MKKPIISFLLFGLILSGCSASTSPQNIISVDTEGNTSFNSSQLNKELSAFTTTKLSASEEDGLIYMREEEKLAQDIYAELYKIWGHNSFNNISKSEQTHTSAVKSLLDKYSLADPATNEAGKFTNNNLDTLYTQLLTQGTLSLTEALKVGATVEEVDIVDLQKYISQTDNPEINLVYENLMRGSRNHLRSYVKNLSNQGITYEPQYLSQADYEQIINNSVEKGNG